ncbi:MAG: nucleoside hydrolase [Candidatus Cyclobacteriaceae bacterium M3_2C_046]
MIAAVSLTCQAQVKIIFDTDFGGDADDLGALAMLHHLLDQQEIELLGIMSWSTEKDVIAAIDAVNRFYDHADIPLGIRSHEYHQLDWNYTGILARQFPHQLTNDQVPLATDLYRKILANQPDHSVVIVTVGPLKNILDLLQSNPDQYSPLNGKDLVHQKVKQMVVMGGKFPEGEKEWNFDGGMAGVTKDVFDQLEVPVILSGFEVGVRIKTGNVFNQIDQDTPLYQGYRHFSEYAPWVKQDFEGEILDNASYDQTAVLFAARGGIKKWWDLHKGGYCQIDASGDNRWVPGPVSNQSYLVLKLAPEKLAEIIESIMLHQE